MPKRALITGITGQDGSHLAEHLLELGYEVHGIVRRVTLEEPERRLARLQPILGDIRLHAASLENYPSIFGILHQQEFDECYHLAAQSFVAETFGDGFSTMATNINGTHYVLESIRMLQPRCRFYFAGSSEMFGRVSETPQDENTQFHPRSPYGISKVAGFHLTVNYRESHGMFCCAGILFNHEGPRRGGEFVSRKITRGVARIKLGLADALSLGNLDALRDWGHAVDYVRAMRAMLQHSQPDDYVVATGETRSVRQFCELAFSLVNLDYRDFVKVDPVLYRPAEVETLCGNAAKAKRILGWEPRYTFHELVGQMVANDLRILTSQAPFHPSV